MPPTAPSFEFPAEQEKTIGTLAQYMKFASIALFATGAVRVAFGVVSAADYPITGLLSVIEGAIVVFMGLVLMAGAGDTRFIVETKGSDTIHLGNAVKSLGVYFKVELGLGVLLVLVLIVDLVQAM